MPKPLRMPATVHLRCLPRIPVGEANRALKMSRQRAHQLRKRHDFPAAVGGEIDTAQLSQWCLARRCRTVWI